MSYTPGLTIADRVRWRVRRRAPVGGVVMVAAGDDVAATDVVARAELPGDVVPLNVADRLGVAAGELPKKMTAAEGDAVAAGALLAASSGPFGWFRREVVAPCDGTVESVSEVTGRVIFREPPRPVEVTAFLSGRVVEADRRTGVVVEADAAVVQGVFGIGGETSGVVRPAVDEPDDDLEVLAIERHGASAAGAVLVGGRRVTADAVRAAVDRGVAAIVTGGIDDAELRDVLGYEIGVAVTGDEQVGLTLVITEGFGPVAMADRTFKLLRSLEGRTASVDGTTQIRAGVMRPVVVVPHGETDADVAGDEAAGGVVGGRLAVGADVRVIRDPHFGTLGAVSDLPAEMATLGSGSLARVAEVTTADGDRLVVPRANLELVVR